MKNFDSLLGVIPGTSRSVHAAAPGKTGLKYLVLATLLLLITPAWAQKFDWTKKIANTTGKTAVVTDKAGNSYVLTSFSGTIALGNSNFTSYGGTDLFLIKYNPNGSLSWLRRISSTGNEQAGDLVLSADEKNVYVTGSFQNTVKFESNGTGVSALTSAGQLDGFVAQFSTGLGSFGWARRFGGTGNDYSNGVALDKAENVYLTGSFSETMKFSLPFTALSLTSSGQSDVFLLKYGKYGDFKLVRKLGGIGYDLGSALLVEPEFGNIFLTGGFSPGANPYVTDVLVAKYSPAGTLLWAKTAGQANQADLGTDLVFAYLQIYVTGYFGGTISFDDQKLTSKGSADIFVANYPISTSSKANVAYSAGGTGWDEGQSIAFTTYQRQPGESSIGRLYVGGVFNGTATFGYHTITAKSAGQDMFLAAATSGTFLSSVAFGSYGTDYGRGGIAIADANTILYTGQYGSPIYLSYPTLSGPGSILTKITLPTVTGLQLVNATTDTDLKVLKHYDTINYVALGTKQINIRANTRTGSSGSVLLRLDGASLVRDSSLPFTVGGDKLKADGGYDYLPLTLAAGSFYRLEVVPYSGPNGTGISGNPLSYTFFVADKPVVSSLILVNAVTDAFVGNLDKGATLYYSKLATNQVSIMANVHYGLTRSVKFSLDGVVHLTNNSPYSIAGAFPKTGGGFDFLPITLKAGTHHLIVTAYGGTNATGLASDPYDITFTVIADKAFRLTAATVESEKTLATFRAAPNPFSEHTSLLFTSAEGGKASVEVFSPQGVLLERVYEGVVEAGKPYSWEFNAHSLPAGVYISRVRMGTQILHQKIVLRR
jgi:hypothetical protein